MRIGHWKKVMFFLIKDFSSEYHTETAIQLSRKNITKRNRKQKEEIEKKNPWKKICYERKSRNYNYFEFICKNYSPLSAGCTIV